jgi:hypothetical protein
MKCNVGGSDQTLRFTAGASLMAMGLLSHGWRRKLGVILGAVGLATAAARYCPINQLAGRNTRALAGSGERAA